MSQPPYYMNQRGRPASNAHGMARAPPGMAGGVGGMGQMGGGRYGAAGGMRGGGPPGPGSGSMAPGMAPGHMGHAGHMAARSAPAARGGLGMGPGGMGQMMGSRGGTGIAPRGVAGMPSGRGVSRGAHAAQRMVGGAGGNGNTRGGGLGFDMNDFPSLGAAAPTSGAPDSYRNAAAGAGTGVAEPPQAFAMSSADFPALPGSGAATGGAAARGGGGGGGGTQRNSGGRSSTGHSGTVSGFAEALSAGRKQKRGAPPPTAPSASAGGGQVEAPGVPSGVKGSRLDKYGLLGLLHVIRMTDADLNTLALGLDLTSLGLNLNSPECLYATFASPWVDKPTTQDPQFSLPACYNMQPPALKTGHLSEFALETLFYIFYAMPRDSLQAYAAQELYKREWRYHKELRLWFARYTGDAASGAAASQYVYFDINSWDKRTFTGSIPGLTAGFLSPAEVQVKV